MKKIFLYPLIVFATTLSCSKSDNFIGPVVKNFFPQKFAAYNYITIKGSHFDSIASKNIVTFNGLPGSVFSAKGDSELVAIAPKDVTAGKISVKAYSRTATSTDSYSILAGSWIRKSDLPNATAYNTRANDIGFSIGNTGYIGLGTNNGVAFNDLYAYDPTSDKWTQKSSLPIGLESAFCMVINGKAYAGTGETRVASGLSDKFFEYDPVTDQWTAKASFPGPLRREVVGFAAGNMGYAGMGRPGGTKDWWQYDPGKDNWTRRADFPGTFLPPSGYGFALNDKIYVGGPAIATQSVIVNEWWQYDPANDTWSKKKNPPWGYDALIGVVINNKGYLMGYENWRYDEVTDSWTQQSFFGTRLFGAVFSIGNKGYYGTGLGYPSIFYNADLWEYSPE